MTVTDECSWANADAAIFNIGEVWNIVTALDARGVDVGDVLRTCGLTLTDLLDPKKRICLDQLVMIYRFAAAKLSPSAMAQVGGRQHLTTFGIVGFAMISSPTLADALDVAQRFWPLVNARFALSVTIRGQQTQLSFVDLFEIPADVRTALVTIEIAKICAFLRDLFGDAFAPQSITVDDRSRSAVDALAPCSAITQVGAEISLTLDTAMLHRPLIQAHPITHRASIEECTRLIGMLHRSPPLVERVMDEFYDLDIAVPSLGEIAKRLAMSERTLRRRLNECGTSYSRILDDVRFTAAKQQLVDSRLTTDDIAERLGYSEVSNFRHAFKRWHGRSPQAFRISQISI